MVGRSVAMFLLCVGATPACERHSDAPPDAGARAGRLASSEECSFACAVNARLGCEEERVARWMALDDAGEPTVAHTVEDQLEAWAARRDTESRERMQKMDRLFRDRAAGR